MKRLAFILFALACCVVSARQAFTPRRPFVPALPASAGPFNPTNIAGMAYWWNADDLTNLVNQAVNSWTDRVQQVVFTNALSASRPLYTNYGLFFSGSQYLSNRPGISVPHNDSTFVALSRQANANSRYYYLTWCQSSAAGMQNYSVNGDADVGYDGGGWVCIRSSGTAVDILCSSLVPHDSLLTLCTARGLGSFTNGIASDAVGWPDDKFDTFGGQSAPLSGEGFVGPIYEILIYTNLITATDVSNLNQYAQTWSIKGTPVYFSTQPTPSSVTCLTNTIQSFTTAASGLSIGYRWRTNGVFLSNGDHWSGANTNVLWVTNDTTAYSNLLVDCVVTNQYYSVTSSSASLNVFAGWPYFTSGTLSVYDFASMNQTSGDTLSGVLNGIDSAGRFDLIATNSPTWLTNSSINSGRGFVRLLRGSTQNLRTNFTASFPQPTTVWAVISNDFQVNNAYLDTSGTGVPEQVMYGGNGIMYVNAGGVAQSRNISTARWRVWQFCFNGTTSFVNTNNVTCVAASNIGTAGRKGTCIGDGQQGGYPATLDISFLAIYTNVLSASESNAMYFYLSQKFPTAAAP